MSPSNDGEALILRELTELGFKPKIHPSPFGNNIFIDYVVPAGIHLHRNILLGVSIDEPYPKVPPHFIHLSPPFNDGLGGGCEMYEGVDMQGGKSLWRALSRPPSDLWEVERQRNMRFYINEHAARICRKLL